MCLHRNCLLGSACSSGCRWNHPNDVHHAQVLVAENVAMKDEIANVVPAEIHAERDAGEWMFRVLVPERNLDRIQVLAVVGEYLLGAVEFEVVLRFHQEVNLMDVKCVIFERTVLDGPLFHRSLSGHDVGRSIGIEYVLRLPLHVHEELRWVLAYVLVEERRALYRHGCGGKSGEALLSCAYRVKPSNLIVTAIVQLLVNVISAG